MINQFLLLQLLLQFFRNPNKDRGKAFDSKDITRLYPTLEDAFDSREAKKMGQDTYALGMNIINNSFEGLYSNSKILDNLERRVHKKLI